jgi:hypothetical protein
VSWREISEGACPGETGQRLGLRPENRKKLQGHRPKERDPTVTADLPVKGAKDGHLAKGSTLGASPGSTLSGPWRRTEWRKGPETSWRSLWSDPGIEGGKQTGEDQGKPGRRLAPFHLWLGV